MIPLKMAIPEVFDHNLLEVGDENSTIIYCDMDGVLVDFDAIFNCDVPIPTPPPTPQCGDIITTSAASPTSIIDLSPNTNNGYSIQGTIVHSPFNFDGTSPNNIYLSVEEKSR